MRKRLQKGLSLVLALTFVLALAIPAGAGGELKLSVNGEETAADLVLQDARSYIEMGSLAAVNGADVEVAEEQKVINGKTYVPLRAVAESLGFQVKWTPGLVALDRVNQTEQPVSVEPAEDGLTAMDVLVKSNQAAQKINTYSMSGYINQSMVMDMDGEEMPIETASEISGQIQTEPMKIYMKQTVELPGEMSAEMPEEMLAGMEMETYLDEEFMYMKSPGQEGWLRMPHFLPMEVLKEQQQITSDPLRAAEQMLEMGYEPSFGEDVTIDGRDCYTVNATIDMKKALESQQELLQQIMGSVGQIAASEMGAEADPALNEAFSAAFELVIAKMTEEGVFDYQLSMFIDKETFLPAQVNLKMTMKLDFDMQEFVEIIAEATGEEISAEELAELQASLKMDSVQQGEIRMFDYGAEFVEPDLSQVITPEEMMPVPDPAAE